MATEIERKFLLADETWRAAVAHAEEMAQGYLAGPPQARCSVRVRIAGDAAFLNIKSLGGVERDEYDYAIPPDDARHMLETLAGNVVEKRRHHVRVDGWLFEIDEFAGANAGLVVAEIELPAVDAAFPHPHWLGREVSGLARYYNLNLALRPYVAWTDAERRADDAPVQGVPTC